MRWLDDVSTDLTKTGINEWKDRARDWEAYCKGGQDPPRAVAPSKKKKNNNNRSANQQILRILWNPSSLPYSQKPATCPYRQRLSSPYNLPWRHRSRIKLQLYSFFNPGARLGVCGQRHVLFALPSRKRLGTHHIGGLVGPRAGLGWCGKLMLPPGSIPGPSSCGVTRLGEDRLATSWPRRGSEYSDFVYRWLMKLIYWKLRLQWQLHSI